MAFSDYFWKTCIKCSWTLFIDSIACQDTKPSRFTKKWINSGDIGYRIEFIDEDNNMILAC